MLYARRNQLANWLGTHAVHTSGGGAEEKRGLVL